MRAGLDSNRILKAAADMADAGGIASVTLKSLAQELGVKSPSLYKHIDSLDDLKHQLTLYSWQALEQEILRSAVGKAKDDAIREVFYAFRRFVKAHPGLFEAMQWYNMYLSPQDLQATAGTVELLFQILDGYDLAEQQKVHIVRMFRGFLQGFLGIESNGGYGNPMSLDASFDFALDIILSGIHNLQGGTQ